MRQAIDETERRRAKQMAYNEAHGIEPASIVKAIHDLTEQVAVAHATAESRGEYRAFTPAQIPRSELSRLIKDLETQMKAAAESLEFEKAAALRDQVFELRDALADKDDLPPWRRARALAGEE
jgi:excinuclease ABC subunit B